MSNIIKHFEFADPKPFSAVTTNESNMDKTINWFIPPVTKGSGGHLNIFRFAKNLEQYGYKSRFIVVAESLVGDDFRVDGDEIYKRICEWYLPLNADCYRITDDIPSASYAMATGWQTAYYVDVFQDKCIKCYFIQDYEPWFYAKGTESALAENTYKLGFIGITAGNWLKDIMQNDYGMKAFSVGFSYEKELYRVKEVSKKKATKKIFFYARPPTPRRAFDLGVIVLNKVKQFMPEVEILMAGWDLSGYDLPFQIDDRGISDLKDLPDIYTECDVALVLSFSNLSLLPLELMACGVPVVSNSGKWVEWLLSTDNAVLCDTSIKGLADGIISLLKDEAKRQALITRGLNFSAQTSWEDEAKKFHTILESLI